MIAEVTEPTLLQLQNRLQDLEASLLAIRSGTADALVGEAGVLHVGDSGKPYVAFFSVMNEGGVTLDDGGAILHGNPRFAAMMQEPIERLRGRPFLGCIDADDRERADRFLAGDMVAVCEVNLAVPGRQEPLPVRLSLTKIEAGNRRFSCLVATELSERIRSERELRNAYAHQQSMIEAERKHVAREIHDELGQLLTALRMETSLLQRELPAAGKPAARIEEMLELIEGLFERVRRVAGSLRPPTMDLGLIPAIEWLAQDFEKRSGIECALDLGLRDIAADENYMMMVFRMVQESLTNVMRHAQATNVSIALEHREEGVCLEIEDDGAGFDPGARADGFGLLGMRERVQELGGKLTVRTEPGAGTRIRIELPPPGSDR